MAQHDPTLPVTKEELGSNDFETYAAKMKDVIDAIISGHSGAEVAAYAADHMISFTNVAPNSVVVSVRENGNDLTLFNIDPTTGAVSTPVTISGYLPLAGGVVTGDLNLEGTVRVGKNGGGYSFIFVHDDTADVFRRIGWNTAVNGAIVEDSGGVQREIVHAGNLQALIAAIGKEGVSAYQLVEVVDSGALPLASGTTVFAYQIEFSATTGNSSGNPASGSYRLHSRANAANPFCLVKRID